MPKELLTQLIRENQYHYIAITGITFLFVWMSFIKFALLLNKMDIMWRRVLPRCIPAVFFSLFGKVLVPQKYFGFFALLITFFMVLSIGKLTLKRAISITIMIFFLSFFGLIIVEPIIFLNKNLHVFFFQTPLGIIIGGLIEGSFPFMLSKILKYNNYALGRKTQKSEIFGMILFVVLFLTMCSLMSQYISLIVDSTNDFFVSSFILQIILIITAFLVFILKHQSLKREQKDRLWEQLQQQLEQSSALIGLLAAEQRELRNKLQVLKSLVDLGKSREAVEYIDRINSEMIDTKTIDFDNPIVGSALLEEIVQGRELGVEIKIENGVSLKEMGDSFEIGRALKFVLNYFFNNRAVKEEKSKEIVVSIGKGVDNYRFDIFWQKNHSYSLREVDQCEDDDQNLKAAESIIKKLDGRFSYGYFHEVLMRFSLEVPATA
mgnify:CR=1 FL=1